MMNRKSIAPILLMLGMVLLIIGMSTNQEVFTYMAIALALIAFTMNTKFFRRKK